MKINDTTTAATSLLIAGTMNSCLDKARNTPPRKMLFSEFWHEGELAILFGIAGAGKSLLAVKLAEALASGQEINGFATETEAQKVLYIDFESSGRQLVGRYPEHSFSENLIRLTMNPGHWEMRKYGRQLVAALEEAVEQHGAKVLIIDNLSAIRYFVNEVFFISLLLQLKSRCQLSILLTADAKNLKPGSPVSLQHMHANKLLAGVADSVFAINTSKQEEDGRYIIQLKGKESGRVYHQHRVVTGRHTVTPVTGLPGFTFTGYSTEQEQLVPPAEGMDAEILDLHREEPHLSINAIARRLNIHKMKVKRVLDRFSSSSSSIKTEKTFFADGFLRQPPAPTVKEKLPAPADKSQDNRRYITPHAIPDIETVVIDDDNVEEFLQEFGEVSFSRRVKRALAQQSLKRRKGK